jgi:hypothetical protein
VLLFARQTISFTTVNLKISHRPTIRLVMLIANQRELMRSLWLCEAVNSAAADTV